LEAIIKKGKIGETYLLGGNSEFSNLEITKKIIKIMNTDDSVIEYVKDRAGHDLRYAIDYSKAKRELSWEPKISLEEGLKNTVKWYKKNRAWWQKIKV
jgi:dTDP-glucose 4,6-dehydratase